MPCPRCGSSAAAPSGRCSVCGATVHADVPVDTAVLTPRPDPPPGGDETRLADADETRLTPPPLSSGTRPGLTSTLSVDYTIPLPQDWLLTLHSDLYRQSAAWARVFNEDPYDKIKPYTNINLAMILTNEPAGWKIMAFVRLSRQFRRSAKPSTSCAICLRAKPAGIRARFINWLKGFAHLIPCPINQYRF